MGTRHYALRGVVCAAVMVCAGVACLAADEPETIYVANTKVITIREAGPYSSVKARAVAIDKIITDIISTRDTQKPQVTIKEVNGLWTIYAWDTAVTAVYPLEAQTNDLPAQSLAAVWANNLREALPKATPCSRLPASAFQPAAGAARPVPVASAAPVAPAVRDAQPAAPVAAVPATAPEAPAVAPAPRAIGAPTLLVRDAFNTVRALSEEEYIARREELVNHLIADLTPFLTGRAATTVTPIEAAGPAPVRAVPSPVTPPTPEAPVAPIAEAPPTPAVERPRPTPTATTAAPAAVDLPEAKPGDPAYAKVPQKNRIRQKLEMTREPFLALRNQDPVAARPISDLLTSCRAAFARGDFDESERDVDEALRLLGVQ